jgi:anthranilate phosphoribosyltransferase
MLDAWTEKIKKGHNLSESEAEVVLSDLLSEGGSDDERAELLAALADKGESVDEICGFAKGMMARCLKVDLGPQAKQAFDLCGTGGSGLERFNVSTTVAFVLGAMGIPVAKHGNRGSRKSNGSFDLLEVLGVPFEMDVADKVKQFQNHQLTFLFARAHHPAVKAVGPARTRLGRRTIFNLVGPLCNPAGVGHQVLGVSDPKLGPLMAEALLRLGKSSALVVWGEPGIDEFSLAGESRCWWVKKVDGQMKVVEESYAPSDFGLQKVDYEVLPKGDAETNAKIFKELVAGSGNSELMSMVALNAAAAVVLRDDHKNMKQAYQEVLEYMKSGKVKSYFEALLS